MIKLKNIPIPKIIHFTFFALVLWLLISFNVSQKELPAYNYSTIIWDTSNSKCIITIRDMSLSSFVNVNFKSYTIKENKNNIIIKIFVNNELPFISNNTKKEFSITLDKKEKPIFLGIEDKDRVICTNGETQ